MVGVAIDAALYARLDDRERVCGRARVVADLYGTIDIKERALIISQR